MRSLSSVLCVLNRLHWHDNTFICTLGLTLKKWTLIWFSPLPWPDSLTRLHEKIAQRFLGSLIFFFVTKPFFSLPVFNSRCIIFNPPPVFVYRVLFVTFWQLLKLSPYPEWHNMTFLFRSGSFANVCEEGIRGKGWCFGAVKPSSLQSCQGCLAFAMSLSRVSGYESPISRRAHLLCKHYLSLLRFLPLGHANKAGEMGESENWAVFCTSNHSV